MTKQPIIQAGFEAGYFYIYIKQAGDLSFKELDELNKIGYNYKSYKKDFKVHPFSLLLKARHIMYI